VTIIVSFCTEMLVTAIGGVTEHAHISSHFIGIVLLPIVGNACEHAAAVRFAMMDKLGLSVSIAVGSSTQIALFVVPFSVLVGWALDKPMDLNFGPLSTSIITLSVIVVLSMVVDGQSNWLQGYLLCSVYAIVAVMYWYLPDQLHDGVS
jgi:Ca2+:H+ antiporter